MSQDQQVQQIQDLLDRQEILRKVILEDNDLQTLVQRDLLEIQAVVVDKVLKDRQPQRELRVIKVTIQIVLPLVIKVQSEVKVLREI